MNPEFQRGVEFAVPAELVSLQQWVAWWSVYGEGVPVKLPNGSYTQPLKPQQKPHKLPINPTTGGLARTNGSRTWSSLDAACAAAQRYGLTGVGFVFTDSDPYSGIDIDNCRNVETGVIADWARKIIGALDSYTEVSPSRTGIHIIVRGEVPLGKGNQATHEGGKVEMFSRLRYFTFTGERVSGTPVQIAERSSELLALHESLFSNRDAVPGPKRQQNSCRSDSQLIDKALQSKNGGKFKRLWDGQWEGDFPSQSEADFALCCHLAFWTDKNAAHIATLFRQSGLMREKWDRPDYLERTVGRAIASTGDTYGPKGQRSRRLAPSNSDGLDAASCNLIAFPHTDIGNGERLVALYGHDIRFGREIKKWLAWDGNRWMVEHHHKIRRLFKKTIRETYRQATDVHDQKQREALEKHARLSESAPKVKAALECAESEDGIAISASALDTHPYLLNCANGTLDLCTGQLKQPDRQHLITKIVRLNYHASAACPQFMRFLRRLMGENPDAQPREETTRLVTFLQKCFGSALTGDVSDKALFCFFGCGNNGKTTLLETIRFVLAEYSAQILIDSLMANRNGESNTARADLADLQGARFVTTSEAEEGQHFALAKIKYLTQGMGEIKVCRKYENPFVFLATHKLFIDANHKPLIRGGEKAVWNRLKPVPFTVTIPPAEIDKQLLEKLKGEAEGILAWMVEGCMLWREGGLGEPPEVNEAIAAWREESDHFQIFFDEHFIVEADAYVPATSPWEAYKVWCDSTREESRLNKTQFDKRLAGLGCASRRRNDGRLRVWVGVRGRNSNDEISSSSDKVTGSDNRP